MYIPRCLQKRFVSMATWHKSWKYLFFNRLVLGITLVLVILIILAVLVLLLVLLIFILFFVFGFLVVVVVVLRINNLQVGIVVFRRLRRFGLTRTTFLLTSVSMS